MAPALHRVGVFYCLSQILQDPPISLRSPHSVLIRPLHPIPLKQG